MSKRHFMCRLFLFVFALLVCNTAGSLASGLAGCLAFAAAAVLNALLEVARCESLDSLHGNILRKDFINRKIITHPSLNVNKFCEIRCFRRDKRGRQITYFLKQTLDFSFFCWFVNDMLHI